MLRRGINMCTTWCTGGVVKTGEERLMCFQLSKTFGLILGGYMKVARTTHTHTQQHITAAPTPNNTALQCHEVKGRDRVGGCQDVQSIPP